MNFTSVAKTCKSDRPLLKATTIAIAESLPDITFWQTLKKGPIHPKGRPLVAARRVGRSMRARAGFRSKDAADFHCAVVQSDDGDLAEIAGGLGACQMMRNDEKKVFGSDG